jgi:hypothetical protein
MSYVFGPVDEAVYYTLTLMPMSGNESLFNANGYTTTEIFEFWLANVDTNSLLAEHSAGVTLTQTIVNNAVDFGAKRALYKIVFGDGANSRNVINPVFAQLPVPSRQFLAKIGIFDKDNAARLATCRIVNSVYAPAPALSSGVLPPCMPRNVTLSIVLPQNATLGCPIATADVVTQALALEGTACDFVAM